MKFSSRACVAVGAAAVALTSFTSQVDAQNSIIKNMYTNVEHTPCTRLFTRDGLVGCGTERDLNEGSLRSVANQAELDIALADKTAPKWTFLMPGSLLTNANIVAFNTNGRVAAVLIDPATSPATNPGTKDINNVNGDDLITTNVNFAIHSLLPESIDSMQAFAKKNADVGYHVAQTHRVRASYYMGPDDTNSADCLSRRQCDPIGGNTVWATLGSVADERPVVMAAARLDANALFHDLSYGANDAAAGIVVMLGVADALSKFQTQISAADSQIILALFQGEAYDLMGSQRFVDDISSGCRGFRNNNGQFNEDGTPNSEDGMYSALGVLQNSTISCFYPPTLTVAFNDLLSDPFKSTIIVEKVLVGDDIKVLNADGGTGDADALAALVIATATANAANSSVTFTNSLAPIPTTSTAQTFVTRTTELPRRAVLLSGTDSTFESTYSSRADRFTGELDPMAVRLGAISAVVAQSLLKEAGIADIEASTAAPDAAVMVGLSECLLKSMVCDLVATTMNLTTAELENNVARQAASRLVNITEPTPLYVGVYRMFAAESGSNKLIERFSRAFMSIKMSPPVVIAEEDVVSCTRDRGCSGLICEDLLPGSQNTTFACVAGACTCSTAQFHDAFALGLAQTKDDDNTMFRTIVVVDDDAGKAWTEPVWSGDVNVLVTQTGSAVTPVAMILAGLAFTLVSVLGVNRLLASSDPKFKVL